MFIGAEEEKQTSYKLEMEKHKEWLNSSTKRYFCAGKNSSSYLTVLTAIDDLLSIKDLQLPGSTDTSTMYLGAPNGIYEMYDNIIKACKAYLSSHKFYRFTGVGKARKSYVEQILKEATEERANIFGAMESLIEGYKRKLEGYNILRSLVSEDPSDKKASCISEKKSSLFDENNDLVKPTPPTFVDAIKVARTEIIDISARSDVGKTGGNASEVIIVGKGNNARYFKEDENTSAFSTSYRKINQAAYAKFRAKIPVGSNLSKRNIAASRLAHLLGIDTIVVKTKSAIVREKGKDDCHGIIMEGAKGKEAKNFLEEHKGKYSEVLGRYSPGEYDISREAQRQLINLQVFDFLSG